MEVFINRLQCCLCSSLDFVFCRHGDETVTLNELLLTNDNFGTKMVHLIRKFKERSFKIV